MHAVNFLAVKKSFQMSQAQKDSGVKVVFKSHQQEANYSTKICLITPIISDRF